MTLSPTRLLALASLLLLLTLAACGNTSSSPATNGSTTPATGDGNANAPEGGLPGGEAVLTVYQDTKFSHGVRFLGGDGTQETLKTVASALTARYRNVLPVRIDTTETVINADASSLTALNLGGLGAMERVYTIIVTSMGLAVFLLAMMNERRREFGAMRALGANLGHLRRFLFAEASVIAGMSLILGTLVGILLAYLLTTLLNVIFTIPAHGLAWPGTELLIVGGFVIVGMVVSTLLSARRLGTLRVVEVLREL